MLPISEEKQGLLEVVKWSIACPSIARASSHNKDYCLSRNQHCAIYRTSKLQSGKTIKHVLLQNGN